MRAIISKPHGDENFTTGSVPFRIGYMHSLAGSIEVDDGKVRIKGNKDLREGSPCNPKRIFRVFAGEY
jgi:hypothetical protein